MIVPITRMDLEISNKYQHMCLQKNNSFRNGCPNYGKKPGCPPRNLFNEDYDLTKPIYLISTDFDLTDHVQRIKIAHPIWTEKAIYNPRYWQAKARKLHEKDIADFLSEHPEYFVERSPEGAGINVNDLCTKLGINLEWPPRKITRIVSVGAKLI